MQKITPCLWFDMNCEEGMQTPDNDKIVIKDLQLSLEVDAPLMIIKEAKPKFEQALRTLEPLKWSSDKEEMKISMSKNPIWGGWWDAFWNFYSLNSYLTLSSPIIT